jgi:hypothetical protein
MNAPPLVQFVIIAGTVRAVIEQSQISPDEDYIIKFDHIEVSEFVNPEHSRSRVIKMDLTFLTECELFP